MLKMRVSVPTDILIRELDSEAVLLNLKSERYFGLDKVGTSMWMALCKFESITSAYEVLKTEYDVDADLLRKDLNALVEKLVNHGLLEFSGG